MGSIFKKQTRPAAYWQGFGDGVQADHDAVFRYLAERIICSRGVPGLDTQLVLLRDRMPSVEQILKAERERAEAEAK